MLESEGDTQDNLSFAPVIGLEEPHPRRWAFWVHRGPFTSKSPTIAGWLARALQDPDITPPEQADLLRAMAPDVSRWADEHAPGLWAFLDEVFRSGQK